jgi:hypothetical protein
MYVANLTHQVVDFQYRLPEYKSPRAQQIPIGGQIRISGDLSPQQIDLIIRFHTKYGMVKFSEVSDFKGWYIPTCYRIDDPISAELIAEGVVQNRELHMNMGRILRRDSAITVNAQIEENLKGEKISNFQFDIEEKSTKDRDPVMEPETFMVTRDKKRGAPQGPENRSPISMVTDFIRARPKKAPSF